MSGVEAVLAAHERQGWGCACMAWHFTAETVDYGGQHIRAGHRTHVAAALAAAGLTTEADQPRDGLRALIDLAQRAIASIGTGGHGHWREGGSGGHCGACAAATEQERALAAELAALLADQPPTPDEGGARE